MTPDDVLAAAERLVQFHERFAPLFGKEEAQDHACTYLKGLMCCPERKSIEPIALCTGDGRVPGLQKFIGVAPWQSDDVTVEIQSVFADELAALGGRHVHRHRRRPRRVWLLQEGDQERRGGAAA